MTQVTDYEMGFRQQIGDNSALGIVASYREYRNLIQLYRFIEIDDLCYQSRLIGRDFCQQTKLNKNLRLVVGSLNHMLMLTQDTSLNIYNF